MSTVPPDGSDPTSLGRPGIARPARDSQVAIPFADWQKVQAVEMLLARYLRAVAEPDALVE